MTRRGLLLLCCSLGQKIKLRSDGSERIKVQDNRDNVAIMLRKLLRLNGHSIDFSEMMQYGCWLQLLNTEGWDISNKGEPVDELDRAGRQWFKCHQCTAIDEPHCMGINQNYGQPAFEKATSSYTCPGQPNTCDHNACSCDVQLAEDLAAYADTYDERYNSPIGDFDIATGCTATGGNGAGMADTCCGLYPLRFPFHSDDGVRGCCNGKTYDTNNMICCSDGRVDISCEPQSNPCDPNPCSYGGVCTANPLTNVAVCECKDPYWGEFCDQKRVLLASPCANNPCLNGGTCSEENFAAICECPGGYKGPFCETSPCFPNPCYNKAECIVMDNDAVCRCKDGYGGLLCEHNPCDPNPCQNGGECSLFDGDSSCLCTEDYEGSFCEVESVKDPCLDLDCQNGGMCVLHSEGPTCHCATDYEGDHCETAAAVSVPIDFCASKPLDLIFVLDRSGSVKYQNEFFKGAKSWIEEFLQGFILETFVNVGIISFGNEAKVDLPLKSHPINKVVKRLSQIFSAEGENSTLNAALDLAHSQLKGSQADRAVLVFSDFWSTDGVFPYESAVNLAFRGASVFSIGLSKEMMELYGKLNALLDPHRVFQINEPDQFGAITPKVKKQICATKAENEQHKASNFDYPDLSFDATDTAKLSLQFDTTGKLPSLSRSVYDTEFDESEN